MPRFEINRIGTTLVDTIQMLQLLVNLRIDQSLFWDPSINPMDSTQEMKSKQGPESTSDSLENKFKNFYYKIYTFTTTNLHQLLQPI